MAMFVVKSIVIQINGQCYRSINRNFLQKYTVISWVFVEQAKPVVQGKGDDFQTVVPRATSQGQQLKISALMPLC